MLEVFLLGWFFWAEKWTSAVHSFVKMFVRGKLALLWIRNNVILTSPLKH